MRQQLNYYLCLLTQLTEVHMLSDQIELTQLTVVDVLQFTQSTKQTGLLR